MRKILMLTAVLMAFVASAQQFSRIYLFDKYESGIVKMKNRSRANAQLNYDASNKTMLYRQGSDLMELTNLEQVDTVIVANRRFVPIQGAFYEVIKTPYGNIFIDWLLKDVNIGSRGALGAVTQGSVKTLKNHDLGGYDHSYTPYQSQDVHSTDVYNRKNDNTYYFFLGDKRVKVKKMKDILKHFKAHEAEIKAFEAEKEIDMKQVHDALMMIGYALSLQK